jgi:hypothetical protein
MNHEQPITVEKFAGQLKERVEQIGKLRDNYVLAGDLGGAIDEALRQADPETVGYPRMLYFKGDSKTYRTVGSTREEKLALSQGWTREFKPVFEPGFPRSYTELRAGAYPRRVTVLNERQERQFFRAVEDRDRWQLDPTNLMGGSGVSLASILREYADRLKKSIDDTVLVME